MTCHLAVCLVPSGDICGIASSFFHSSQMSFSSKSLPCSENAAHHKGPVNKMNCRKLMNAYAAIISRELVALTFLLLNFRTLLTT